MIVYRSMREGGDGMLGSRWSIWTDEGSDSSLSDLALSSSYTPSMTSNERCTAAQLGN